MTTALAQIPAGSLVPMNRPFKLRCEVTGQSVTVKQVQSVAVLANNCPICANPVEHLIDGNVDPSHDWSRHGEGGPSLLCRSCEANYVETACVEKTAFRAAAADRAEQEAHWNRVATVYDTRLRDLKLAYRRARIDDVQFKAAALTLNAWRQAEQPQWNPVPDKFPSADDDDESREPLNLELTPPVFRIEVEDAIQRMTPDDRKKAMAAEYYDRQREAGQKGAAILNAKRAALKAAQGGAGHVE